MTDYKQNSPEWKNLTYAPNRTYGAYGCFLTSLGNMVNLTPPECANKIKSCISSTGMLTNPQKIAELLGLEYNGISTTKPDYDCIAETTYWDKPSTNQIEQHFFIVKADGTQQDPLGLKTNYPIKTYRLFKGENMKPAFDLFGTPDGKVYFRTWNGYEHIPNPEEAVIHFGSNWGDYVTKIDNLGEMSVEEVMTSRLNDLNTCKSNLTLNENAVTEFKEHILDDIKEITDLQGDVSVLTKKVTDMQNQMVEGTSKLAAADKTITDLNDNLIIANDTIKTEKTAKTDCMAKLAVSVKPLTDEEKKNIAIEFIRNIFAGIFKRK